MKAFPSGVISVEDFSDYVMSYINENKKLNKSQFLDSRLVKTDSDTLFKNIVEFSNKCFSGKHTISIEKDLKLLQFKLLELLRLYEFYRLPQTRQDHISNVDFAKILVSYVNVLLANNYKKYVDENPLEFPGDISFKEFISFFYFLQQYSIVFEKIFSEKEKLGLMDLKKISDKIISTMPNKELATKLSIDTLKIFFKMFDRDCIYLLI